MKQLLSTILLFSLISLSGAMAMTEVKSKLPVHMRDKWQTSTKSIHAIPIEVFITDDNVLIIHFNDEVEITLEVKGTDGEVVYTNVVSSTSEKDVAIDLSYSPTGEYKLFVSGKHIDLEGDFCLQ